LDYSGDDIEQVTKVIEDQYSGFKTLMAISNPTTARRMNFSNPSVQINGTSSGILNFRNNGRLIDQLTPAMTNFGTRPDLIFESGFE